MSFTPQTFPSSPALPYDNALRARLQTGDVLLCSGSGVFSELIQQATDSLWSHVALIVRLDGIDRLLVFESVETWGVRAVPLSRYLTHIEQGRPYPGGLVVVRHRTFASSSSAHSIQRMLQFAVDQFGNAYNRQAIVRIAARILGNSLQAPAALRKETSLKEFICSEYVAACFAQVGVVLTAGDRGYVTPADFADPHAMELIAVLQPLPERNFHM
jgi:hypothetical protein